MRSKYISYGILDSDFVFTIPLYLSMPKNTCSRPSTTVNLKIEGELVTVNSSPTLNLRDSPNGNKISAISNGTIITRIESAKSKINGYYWDKVITSKGTGYMAREASDGSKVYLVPLVTTPIIDNVNNNYSVPDNNIVFVEPNTKSKRLKETYDVVKDKNGIDISDDTLIGTGATVKPTAESTEIYTIVKLGDANGDGAINSGDLLKIQKHLLKVKIMEEINEKASDLNKDTAVNSGDLLKIQKHLLNVKKIYI